MSTNFISNKDGQTISPATEGLQRDLEARLEELKLLIQDQVNVLATSPVAGETQKLTNSSANTDGMISVAAGGTYVFTSVVTGGFYFGLADTQSVINVLWVCGLDQAILIKIPAGETKLHYATAVNSGIGYLRRIA